MTKGADTALVLRRSYPQNRLFVFDAFASASALEKWFSPASDVLTKVIDFDFRTGGRYRVAFYLSDGTKTFIRGEFTRIERPSQLSFTWCWEEPDLHADIDTLVAIDFIDNGETTEVVVLHEKMEDAGMRNRHSAGWQGALDRLQGFLELRTTRKE